MLNDPFRVPATSSRDDIADIQEVHLPALAFVDGIDDRPAAVGAQSWMQVATPLAGVFRGR